MMWFFAVELVYNVWSVTYLIGFPRINLIKFYILNNFFICRLFEIALHEEGRDWGRISMFHVTTRSASDCQYYYTFLRYVCFRCLWFVYWFSTYYGFFLYVELWTYLVVLLYIVLSIFCYRQWGSPSFTASWDGFLKGFLFLTFSVSVRILGSS
jgi:hypothetical protein